jgi:hypothetical protein
VEVEGPTRRYGANIRDVAAVAILGWRHQVPFGRLSGQNRSFWRHFRIGGHSPAIRVWVSNSSVGAADSYFASTASSDNTLPRYNVNTFLNSATTRIFPLGSASP